MIKKKLNILMETEKNNQRSLIQFEMKYDASIFHLKENVSTSQLELENVYESFVPIITSHLLLIESTVCIFEPSVSRMI